MRLGDWVVGLLCAINLIAALGYAWGRHWPQALYWIAAALLNLSLLLMR